MKAKNAEKFTRWKKVVADSLANDKWWSTLNDPIYVGFAKLDIGYLLQNFMGAEVILTIPEESEQY